MSSAERVSSCASKAERVCSCMYVHVCACADHFQRYEVGSHVYVRERVRARCFFFCNTDSTKD